MYIYRYCFYASSQGSVPLTKQHSAFQKEVRTLYRVLLAESTSTRVAGAMPAGSFGCLETGACLGTGLSFCIFFGGYISQFLKGMNRSFFGEAQICFPKNSEKDILLEFIFSTSWTAWQDAGMAPGFMLSGRQASKPPPNKSQQQMRSFVGTPQPHIPQACHI